MSSTKKGVDGDWVPILHLGHEAWLGLLRDDLFVGDLEGPKRQVDSAEPTGLLPCLERPFSVVLAEIRDREAELLWPPGSLIARVPLAVIPHAAVASKSNYWADLALAWLGEMPDSVVDSSALERLEKADWASQSIRHRARRMRRQKK
jgi:hypothetical protein